MRPSHVRVQRHDPLAISHVAFGPVRARHASGPTHWQRPLVASHARPAGQSASPRQRGSQRPRVGSTASEVQTLASGHAPSADGSQSIRHRAPDAVRTQRVPVGHAVPAHCGLVGNGRHWPRANSRSQYIVAGQSSFAAQREPMSGDDAMVQRPPSHVPAPQQSSSDWHPPTQAPARQRVPHWQSASSVHSGAHRPDTHTDGTPAATVHAADVPHTQRPEVPSQRKPARQSESPRQGAMHSPRDGPPNVVWHTRPPGQGVALAGSQVAMHPDIGAPREKYVAQVLPAGHVECPVLRSMHVTAGASCRPPSVERNRRS